jgi:cell division protein FtsL
MASTAVARRAAPAPAREESRRAPLQVARPSARVRHGVLPESRLARALIVLFLCLAVLAAGRVAMSFAVVQKTVATDAIAQEEQRLTAENAQLQTRLTKLGSMVRVHHVARTRLGMVEPEHVTYLSVAAGKSDRAGTEP